MDSPAGYGIVSRTLHWVMAACFAWHFAGALLYVTVPESGVTKFVGSTHFTMGFTLLVLVLSQDAAHVPAAARFSLVERGCADLQNVVVRPGGDYVISGATFPDYFFKTKSEAMLAHARLDATLFAGQIAPACGIKARFVGDEPLDPMTAAYNETLLAVLPPRGVNVTVVPRRTFDGEPVSASRVRALWRAGDLSGIAPLVPPSTLDYIREHAL